MRDDSREIYIDIRRKVGNQIIRAYLLDPIIKENRLERIDASLRDPKNTFKDFDRFIVLSLRNNSDEYRILVETGVYENLRIVATKSEELSKMTSDEIIQLFTDALKKPDVYDTKIILSTNSILSPDSA